MKERGEMVAGVEFRVSQRPRGVRSARQAGPLPKFFAQWVQSGRRSKARRKNRGNRGIAVAPNKAGMKIPGIPAKGIGPRGPLS